MMKPDALGFRLGLVVAEYHRDIDLSGAQELERFGRVQINQADLQSRVIVRERRYCRWDERTERRGKAGQAHSAGGQAYLGRKLSLGRVYPSDDLGRPVGEQLSGMGETDTPADPLQQLRAGLGLQPGQVMTHRWLRVVQRLGRLGDRSVSGDGVDHSEPDQVKHPSILSMGHLAFWH